MRTAGVLLAIGLLIVAVVAPGVAGAVAVAVALAVTGALLARLLAEQRAPVVEPVEPFGPDDADTAPTVETPDVSELLREIGSGRKDLPPRITAQLRDIAAGRLLDGHRIDVTDPADRPRIVALVSDELAAIVLGDDGAASRVPTRRLGRLVDELERL